MNAMNNASDNAAELKRSLTLVMNRKRQAKITTELTVSAPRTLPRPIVPGWRAEGWPARLVSAAVGWCQLRGNVYPHIHQHTSVTVRGLPSWCACCMPGAPAPTPCPLLSGAQEIVAGAASV